MSKIDKIEREDTFWARLDPTIGGEIQKTLLMTFLQKLSFFVAPYFSLSRKEIFLNLFTFFCRSSFVVLWILLMKYTLLSLQSGIGEKYYLLIWGYIFAFICVTIIIYINRFYDWSLSDYRMNSYLFHRYFTKMLHLDHQYVDSIGTGKLIHIIMTGIETWRGVLFDISYYIVHLSIGIVFMIWMTASIHGTLPIFFIIGLILASIGVVWIDAKAHKYRKLRSHAKSLNSKHAVRMIMARGEILQSENTQGELEIFDTNQSEIYSYNNAIIFNMIGIFTFVRGLCMCIRVGILLGLGWLVLKGELNFASFATLLATIIYLESIFSDAADSYKNMRKDWSNVELLWSTIDDGPTIAGYLEGSVFKTKTASRNIVLSNIHFRYTESAPVFTDFSLEIPFWKKIALVGKSGGGKTTLIKLLAGYLRPESGEIHILGNNLATTSLQSYYRHIGYLTQDPSVFDGSIRENLVSVLLERDLPSVEKDLTIALEKARCDFIYDLKDGLDTQIGERWVRLSGGQKQRLAIAKIFLKNPKIILLDEPTSALDSFSEEFITQALDELFINRTVIIVAHRLQTVRNADEILVIDAGKIVQRWDHESLITQWWTYARMLELQSGF